MKLAQDRGWEDPGPEQVTVDFDDLDEDDDEAETGVEAYDEDTFFDFVERVGLQRSSPAVSGASGLDSQMLPVYQNPDMALASAVAILSTLTGRHLASPTYCALNLYITMVAKTGGGKNWPLNAPGVIFEALKCGDLNAGSFASAPALENRLERPRASSLLLMRSATSSLTAFQRVTKKLHLMKLHLAALSENYSAMAL